MKKTTGRTRARRKPVRSATKKTGHKVVRTHTGRRYEFLGLALLAAGLISICGICGLNVGFVGVYFAKFLRYFFGVGSLLVAFLILLIAWTYMTKHRGPKYSPRFFGILALFISVLAIWHHFKVPVGAEILPESLPTGGGLLGGGFCCCCASSLASTAPSSSSGSARSVLCCSRRRGRWPRGF